MTEATSRPTVGPNQALRVPGSLGNSFRDMVGRIRSQGTAYFVILGQPRGMCHKSHNNISFIGHELRQHDRAAPTRPHIDWQSWPYKPPTMRRQQAPTTSRNEHSKRQMPLRFEQQEDHLEKSGAGLRREGLFATHRIHACTGTHPIDCLLTYCSLKTTICVPLINSFEFAFDGRWR